jgi:peptidyl-tRNA hydrolase
MNNNTSAATVIGDVSVEYMLTNDGRYRVKMYNRNNFNSLTNTLAQTFNTTQGISLMYVESFDKLSELLNDARKRAIEERKENDRQVSTVDPESLSQSSEKPAPTPPVENLPK